MLNEIFVADPLSTRQIKNWAEGLLQRFSPDILTDASPVDLLGLLDPFLFLDTGFGLDITAKLNANEEAATNFTKKRIEFSEEGWKALENHQNRARFTAAHEIAHVYLHRQQIDRLDGYVIDGNIRLYREQRVKAFRNPEWQANTGASFLLMPSPGFDNFVRERRGKLHRSAILEDINERYHVSVDAAEVRLSRFEKGEKTIV